MSSRHYLPLVVVLLGTLEMLVCAGGVVAVWSLASRLSRTTEYVFDGGDKSLVAVPGDTTALAINTRFLRSFPPSCTAIGHVAPQT